MNSIVRFAKIGFQAKMHAVEGALCNGASQLESAIPSAQQAGLPAPGSYTLPFITRRWKCKLQNSQLHVQ